MNHGRIAQVGSPSDIYESPANRFVADFIGSVNMFEARSQTAATIACASPAPSLGARCARNRRARVPPAPRCGPRSAPKKINITRRPPAGQPAAATAPENLVRGTVREIAYMGDMSIYLVQIDSGKMLRVTLPNVTRGRERPLTRDESVWLSWHGTSPWC